MGLTPKSASAERSSDEPCGWPRTAARELPELSLEDALQLVHLYAERGSPKYERAAMRWLERYLNESSPRLQHFAQITANLAKLERSLWRWTPHPNMVRPTMAEITPRRQGELVGGVFLILKDAPEGLPAAQILSQLALAVPPTPFESSNYESTPNVRRYEDRS